MQISKQEKKKRHQQKIQEINQIRKFNEGMGFTDTQLI